jgi:hypothetical protein
MGVLRMRTMLVNAAGIKDARPVVERLMKGVIFSSPVLYTIDDIFDRLEGQKMQLWLWYDEMPEDAFLFAITLIEKFPRGQMAHIMLMAGKKFRSAIEFNDTFVTWSKVQKCDYIHFECSPKMATVMKRLGYHATAMAVYKPLHIAN